MYIVGWKKFSDVIFYATIKFGMTWNTIHIALILLEYFSKERNHNVMLSKTMFTMDGSMYSKHF